MVLGGRQFYLPSSVRSQPRNTATFLRARPDGTLPGAKGYPDLVELTKGHESDFIPVWDANEVLLTGRPAGWQIAPLVPFYCRNPGEVLVAYVTAHPYSGLRRAIDAGLSGRPALPDRLKRGRFLTPLLAGNAVVFFSGDSGNWHVMAVGRSNAALFWDMRIPAQPVFGGLSMTRAGDVLAPLVDGRVVCIGVP